MQFRPAALKSLTADGWLLFGTRVVRMLAYGFVSVVLVLYLAEVELREAQIDLLLTLAGDTLISFWLTTNADRLGRRRILMLSSAQCAVFSGRRAQTYL